MRLVRFISRWQMIKRKCIVIKKEWRERQIKRNKREEGLWKVSSYAIIFNNKLKWRFKKLNRSIIDTKTNIWIWLINWKKSCVHLLWLIFKFMGHLEQSFACNNQTLILQLLPKIRNSSLIRQILKSCYKRYSIFYLLKCRNILTALNLSKLQLFLSLKLAVLKNMRRKK